MNESCTLCKNVKQTQRHVISCPSKALEDGRYNWRHYSVLYTLCHQLPAAVNNDDKLYAADLVGFKTPTVMFTQHRADACIAIQLTVCYEHNTTKAREYKEERYGNLQDEIEIEYSEFNPIWTGLFANLKRLGWRAKCSPPPPPPPPPNLAISSQMTMKVGKDIIWVEIFKNGQKFLTTSSSCWFYDVIKMRQLKK